MGRIAPAPGECPSFALGASLSLQAVRSGASTSGWGVVVPHHDFIPSPMRLTGRWSCTSFDTGRLLAPRSITRAVGVLALVTGAACQDVVPTASAPRLAPGKPAAVLTGGSGTNLFPTAAPGDYQQ